MNMKRTLIGALVVALALICLGCNSTNNPTSLDKPSVSAAGSGGGGTLILSWGTVADAKYYEITAGGTVDTTSSTSFDITTPATTFEVRAVNGSVKSDPSTISCKVVEGTATFYGDDVTLEHENGFGFSSSGVVVLCTLATASKYSMDFYAESSHAQINLRPAGLTATKRGNQLKAASGIYDSLIVADSLPYAKLPVVLQAGSSCFLRISADSTGTTWSSGDNFAKMRVDSIVGTKISVTTAYQPIGGLRWLVK
jgi:hypothetical protein